MWKTAALLAASRQLDPVSLEPQQSNISAALGRGCVGSRRVGRLTRMQMASPTGDDRLSVWHRTKGATWAVIVHQEGGQVRVFPDVWTAQWYLAGAPAPAPPAATA